MVILDRFDRSFSTSWSLMVESRNARAFPGAFHSPENSGIELTLSDICGSICEASIFFSGRLNPLPISGGFTGRSWFSSLQASIS
ncbi:MAG: hypothetical protein GF388_05450 [Candidatus Aegiribacteria sp.]|nr:hypothetical protein [Candidatus Aegiribacteria sp.]MBD3294649.1 hypothetical protein [Candidatus Fermentibacteria bacterium]